MINEAIVEGYIARLLGRPGTWKWKRDTLFRLEVRRDPNRPTKAQSDSRNELDFITVRLLAARSRGRKGAKPTRPAPKKGGAVEGESEVFPGPPLAE